MKYSIKVFIVIIVSGPFLMSCSNSVQEKDTKKETKITDPLPSWNEGKSKSTIIDFVNKTTSKGSPEYIPVADRIATFDNDGNLWAEQPMYFQLFFAIDRVRELAPEHPEWNEKQPFKALLEGDMKTALAGGEHALLEIVMATHSGLTTTEFSRIVKDWINSAKHPVTGKLYKDMVYQPMLELLEYLRSNEYKTFIVSGGGVDFMRPWVEEVYGIPPYQVVGSSGKVEYQSGNDSMPELVKLPALNFIDDKEGKPIGIHQFIGKRPVFASGNSDGDYQMLHWTSTASGYPRFAMLLHHTDSVREWSYDINSHIGKLEKGLKDAEKNNWVLVDMEKDWNKIFPDN
jgi:phosphoglycolate phosphatase-like HAD superfamily hydrolase